MSEPSWSPAAPAVDPYAPPKASITPTAADGDLEAAEQIRRELIKHETSIKSVGFLYLFGAVFLVIATLGLLIMSVSTEAGGVSLGLAAFYAVFAAISIYLGRGLRKLSPSVRTGVTILAVIGLLGFPLGTLLNAYILYLLHCEKGKRVMTTEYQSIIAQTPHIKYRTPLWLILLAVLLIGGIIAMLFFFSQA